MAGKQLRRKSKAQPASPGLMKFVVSFKSPKIDRHIVLGQVEASSYLAVHERVTRLLIQSGVDEYDILPTETFCGIKLRDGTFVDIHPLTRLEDWVQCIANNMQGGSILDLAPEEYTKTAGALAKC